MSVEPRGERLNPVVAPHHWLSSPAVLVAGLLILFLYIKSRFDALEQMDGRASRDEREVAYLPPQLKSAAAPAGASYRDYYVPVDARLYHGGGKVLPLEVMLVLQNPNREPIYFGNVDYFDEQNDLLRAYATSPFVLGPLQKVVFLVKEPSAKDPVGSYFLVRWSAESPQTRPLIESIMVAPTGDTVLTHQGVPMRSSVPKGRPLVKESEPHPPLPQPPVGYELKNQTSPGLRQKNP